MKIAVFGGSFNPVHYGHLALAELVQQRLGYDIVIFVPTNQSPLKQAPGGATPQDRLDMLLAALIGKPHVIVDDCEIRRGGLSYTIDTIVDIEHRYQSGYKLGLIIGDDHVGSFDKWKDPELITRKTELLVASRNFTKISKFPYPYRPIENPQWALSSSQIRHRIAAKADWTHLVPPQVAAIIRDRGLYTNQENAQMESLSSSLISLIEDTARAWLPSERFLHSKNVAVLSAQLCNRFHIDERAGYLAGIAHDMCKHFDSKRIYDLVRLDGLPIGPVETQKPELMHGRAGAVYVQVYHNVSTPEVLQAIRMHTFGGPGMGDLAKIVYIADKIEPSRPDINPDLRIACRTEPLSILFARVVSDTLQYLQQRGKLLNQETNSMLAELQREGFL